MAEKTDHDMLIEVHAVLCGINGTDGLCKQFKDHRDNDTKFQEDYYKFKRYVIMIFSFMVGCGALGGGTVGIIKLLGG